MSDLLSNFFSHINNSQQSRILVIEHSQSKIIMSILNILQESGYIRGYRLLAHSSTFPKVEILLKYKNQKPAINKIIRISKPSKRVYFSVKHLSLSSSKMDLSSTLSSLVFMKGIFILSTSRGIMTHLTAYRLNIGGEILCHIS